MKILGYFHDDRYPSSAIEMIRFTSRVYVRDEEGRVAFLQIVGEDGFGPRDHLESPGGGVESEETFVEAAIREIDEELGASATDFELIGVVIDRYNLINRMTFSVYFSAILKTHHQNHHRTDEEKILIDSIVWLTPKEALTRLQKADHPVDALIHRRELAAFSAFLEDLKDRG